MSKSSTKRLEMFAAILLLACASPVLGAASTKVDGGLVAGTEESGLAVYRGIPFAAPPVGNLRWSAPQPAPKWSGTLSATKFGNACMQNRPPGSPSLGAEMSEDCLYLNVWTPAKSPQERLPVMVWIHGGGFGAGATAEPLYSGEHFAQRGVVYVSIGYRIGVFGFMAHPELSAETKQGTFGRASGNWGLLDQIAGLQWVQRNIAAFGGDPRRVTIFGESAGGIAVSMLAASPLAKGLFHGVISQSGGSFGPTRTPSQPGENIPHLPDAERAGRALGEKLGAPSIAQMRAVDAKKVMSTAPGIQGIAWPVLDGYVIPDDQYTLYSAGKYNATPVLIGINSDEGASFGRLMGSESFETQVRRRYGPFADKVLKAYPAADEAAAKQAARDLMRDVTFGWHTWTWARLQNRTKGGAAFVYYFDQRPPFPPNLPFSDAKGAPHAAELPYVFQHLDQQNFPWTEADRALSETMIKYWVNFAKRGDPNDDGVPQWPAFTESNQQRMVLKARPHAASFDNRSQLQTLDEYFAWRRTREGKQFVRANGEASE
jgi:para-nitrobenzyl esterase